MKNKTLIQWICLGASIGYFLVPVDIIPDITPVIGYLDDIVAIYLECKKFFNSKK